MFQSHGEGQDEGDLHVRPRGLPGHTTAGAARNPRREPAPAPQRGAQDPREGRRHCVCEREGRCKPRESSTADRFARRFKGERGRRRRRTDNEQDISQGSSRRRGGEEGKKQTVSFMQGVALGSGTDGRPGLKLRGLEGRLAYWLACHTMPWPAALLRPGPRLKGVSRLRRQTRGRFRGLCRG